MGSTFWISQEQHSSTKENLQRVLKPTCNSGKEMWFRYKYALNWSSPLSLWQMGWNGLVQLDWNAGSSGMSACLWNSPTWNGMPVAACFSLVYFSKQASTVACWVFFDTWNSTASTRSVFQTNEQSKAKGPVAVTSCVAAPRNSAWLMLSFILYSFLQGQ